MSTMLEIAPRSRKEKKFDQWSNGRIVQLRKKYFYIYVKNGP